MRAKAIGTYISFGATILSIIIIIITNVLSICGIENNSIINIINDLFIGVLGGAILSFVLTLSEYLDVRKTTLENYAGAFYSLIVKYYQIRYVYIDDETKLFSKFDRKRKDCELERILNVEHEDYSFKTYLEKCKIFVFDSDDVDDNFVIEMLENKYNDLDRKIKTALKSYIDLEEHSLRELSNEYGNIYFISDVFRKNKIRTKLYNEFNKPVIDMYYQIKVSNRHFKDYLSGEVNNLPAIVQILEETNSKIFCIEERENMTIIWESFADDLYDKYKLLEAKINRQEYKKPERVPVMGISKHIDKNNQISME